MKMCSFVSPSFTYGARHGTTGVYGGARRDTISGRRLLAPDAPDRWRWEPLMNSPSPCLRADCCQFIMYLQQREGCAGVQNSVHNCCSQLIDLCCPQLSPFVPSCLKLTRVV